MTSNILQAQSKFKTVTIQNSIILLILYLTKVIARTTAINLVDTLKQALWKEAH